MKYLTPDRLVRLADLTDESAFLAALQSWEDGLALYRSHLQRLEGRLPNGLRRLIETVYLHDAAVLEMSRGQRGRFAVTLHPASDPARLVTLDYTLVGEPVIDENALPDLLHSSPVCWLYDELDEGEACGGEPTFFHHILLSNGWEVRLRFRKVVVHRPYSLIPAKTPDPALATSPSI